MKSFCLMVAVISSCLALFAQPSTETDLLNGIQARQKVAQASLLKNYPVRNIGPTVQGGRIVDIDVNLSNTKEFYVALASGGVFKTINNGITFEPIFDNLDALGIGDIALSQTDPKILYVGTGEKNSSRSSYAGSGVYKTIDGGNSWVHLGLTHTQHISRIIVHPQNNNTVWLAAIGSLYSKNNERGVLKSVDGGKTWRKTLFINDSTGVIDLVMDPQDPNLLLAASWERSREASNFKGHGEGSSIYRSTDGGETWTKSINGFPQGKHIGRIGLDICATKPFTTYAILDNHLEVEDKKIDGKEDANQLDAEDFKEMSKETFLQLNDSTLNEFLSKHDFPKKYNALLTKKEVALGKYKPSAIAEYNGADANKNIFKTKTVGPELYRSDDAGLTWKKMNSYDLDGIFYSYGYYFSELKVSPHNPDLVYVYGVPLLKSTDGGVTWHRLDTLRGAQEIHVDHHALWINPQDPKHLLLGNDGGLYQSYDEGANWIHINNIPAGQFYTVNVDMETPYNVYGGLQDNGVLKGSSQSIPNVTKHWKPLFSGDGMYVIPDPRDNRIVYTGYQFGNYFKLEMDKKKAPKITPQHDIGQQPLRWNWRAPLLVSKHNPDILYIGANKVFRSLDGGEHWEMISDDLTRNLPSGNVPISTISALAESPLKFGLLYVGTDDGNVWTSKDGGSSWQIITNNLPAKRWVSSLSPSPHDEATIFVSLNGYRNDEFRTYLFMSSDYGKNWKSIKGNLPESVANVIIQDPVNADLLYCGLDNGTYASFDKGNTWHLFNNMLNVASYDMIVHPRENELVVGTHGRSVFIADVKPLQALNDKDINKSILAFTPNAITNNKAWGEKKYAWSAELKPTLGVMYYVGRPSKNITIEIYDEKNNLKRLITRNGMHGFNSFIWDLKIEATPETLPTKKIKPTQQQPQEMRYVTTGRYRIKFINGKDFSEVDVEVK